MPDESAHHVGITEDHADFEVVGERSIGWRPRLDALASSRATSATPKAVKLTTSSDVRLARITSMMTEPVVTQTVHPMGRAVNM
ncbi:hypothetical protein [Streptosporangium sp. NPDC087985]|uniref:hypothetical protein n=1 Tax=Streptosporangium sp. NPDC087985 TaxID=3366196 RepID=UPI00381C16BB